MSKFNEMPENCYKDPQGVLKKLNMDPVLAHVLGGAGLVIAGAANMINQADMMGAVAKIIDGHPELSSQIGVLSYGMGALNFILMLVGAYLMLYSPEQANDPKI